MSQSKPAQSAEENMASVLPGALAQFTDMVGQKLMTVSPERPVGEIRGTPEMHWSDHKLEAHIEGTENQRWPASSSAPYGPRRVGAPQLREEASAQD